MNMENIYILYHNHESTEKLYQLTLIADEEEVTIVRDCIALKLMQCLKKVLPSKIFAPETLMYFKSYL